MIPPSIDRLGLDLDLSVWYAGFGNFRVYDSLSVLQVVPAFFLAGRVQSNT